MNSKASFDASRVLPWLLILFAGSGCSALIYEIVWYQLLQLVIGSTAISLGVLLATFMGGLCIGSLALPRYLAKRKPMHPLRAYGMIELGIGAFGVLELLLMPLVDSVYASAVAHGMPSILFRGFICAICLLPPTILMGASLPAIAQWIKSTPRGVSWLGLLYGGNTAGAVFGCLLAGFFLLRVSDMVTTTLVAAGINCVVALFSLSLSKRTPAHAEAMAPADEPKRAPARGNLWPVYLTIALSGATALGAEVVWTRLLGLMLGATVYTFSIILAIFLIGIGIGSWVGAMAARGAKPAAALGGCQLLLVAAIAWTAFMIARSVPWWPVNPLLSSDPWYTFQIDMVRVIWAILPPTLLWGASFPLALAAAAGPEDDSAGLVGRIYAANTFGAILGALVFTLILIPWIGTQGAEQTLIVLAAVSGLVVLGPLVWRGRAQSTQTVIWAIALLASMLVTAHLASRVQPVPPELIAYGRRMMTSVGRSKILYVGEGINSSIAISRWDDGAIQFHVSGKVEASTESYDMRLQRLLGHMPALFHPDPKSVLIVGFGAGVTAGSFVVHPTIQRIAICEMEPLIPPIATQYFGQQNYFVKDDPRTQIYYDDARHFVLTTPEKFDIITSDPIHPWVKGSATLYSKEYFELVKEHLNPGGVVTQWVPLYESNAETVKSEIATFFDVFPGGSVWANELSGSGYDVFLFGQKDPAQVNIDKIQERLNSPDYARVVQSLRDVGLGTAVGMMSVYSGQDSDLKPWLQGAEINGDWNLRLQYLAGLAVNNSKEGQIYSEILNYRKFPANLITGSPQMLQQLEAAIQAGGQ
jgi:spermidine synthase